MSLDSNFISLLSCPQTQQSVFLAEDDLLNKVNDLIKQGKLRNRSQEVLTDSIEALLVREDKKIAFPVINKIPVLVVNEAIDLEQIANG